MMVLKKCVHNLPYPAYVLEQRITDVEAGRLAAAAAAIERMSDAERKEASLTVGRARELAIRAGVAEQHVDEAIRQGLYWPSFGLVDSFRNTKGMQYRKVSKWTNYFMGRRDLRGFTMRKRHEFERIPLELYLRVQRTELDLHVTRTDMKDAHMTDAGMEEEDALFYHLTAIRGFSCLKRYDKEGERGYRRSPWLPGTKLYINATQGYDNIEYVMFREFVDDVLTNHSDVSQFQVLRHVIAMPKIVEREIRERISLVNARQRIYR